MEDIHSFYNAILNIGNTNNKKIIEKIVKEEREKLLKQTTSSEGFCKYIARQIEERLRDINVKSYFIDLNELVSVDHVILISEYKENNEIKKLLIDPTFEQFIKKDNKQLLHLDEWPSEKIEDDTFICALVSNGVVEIDNQVFNNYLNAFSTEKVNIHLDQYLLDDKLNSIPYKKI